MSITRIKKWGNSYAIRIPKEILDTLGIRPDDLVEVLSRADHLTVTPVPKPTYTLDELVDQITTENIHEEIPTSPATGAEIW